MEKANLEQLESFITADGSSIRELAGPAWTQARNQSLAEATRASRAARPPSTTTSRPRSSITSSPARAGCGSASEEAEVGGRRLRRDPARDSAQALEPGPEPLVLLCCCAPAYSDDDTVMTGG